MKKLSILFWMLIFSACTKTSPLVNTRWSGSGKKPALELFDTTLNSKPAWASSKETVQISEQMYSHFRIEGAFVKTISNKQKNIIFQSSSLVSDISKSNKSKADKMDKEKDANWNLFKDKSPIYKFRKVTQPVEVVFTTLPKLKPFYKVITELPTGELQATYFDDDAELVNETRLGSNLTDLVDSPSLAFTKGPKKSELSAIILTRKIQPEGLANTLIDVSSESPNKITSSSNLQFQPSDDRLDQVQAFYFSHLILQWFDQKLSLHGPYKLSIVTQLGYPDKTNAAFYFQNQIRLGAGDDITFSNMAWDPTIVMHETSHAVIDSIARLPFQGEGGSLNEGYADLFTTVFLDSPLLGDNSYRLGPFKRTVDSTLKLSEKNDGLYHDSAIVSGFFWSLKKLLGPDKTLDYALHVLNRLGPNSTFADFKLSLEEQKVELFKDDDLKKVNTLLTERDL